MRRCGRRRHVRPRDPRHDQQLRLRPHAVGHVPRLRGELQRLFRQRVGQHSAPSRRATASPTRDSATAGRNSTSASTRRSTRTSRIASAGWSRSTRGIRRRRRSSARRSAASSTRARRSRSPRTTASSSTWATTSASSTSTSSSREGTLPARRPRRQSRPARRRHALCRAVRCRRPRRMAAAGVRAGAVDGSGRLQEPGRCADPGASAGEPSARRKWIGRSGSRSRRSIPTCSVTLTNNNQRGGKDRPGTDAANPRADNVFGQILRWSEEGGDPGGGRVSLGHLRPVRRSDARRREQARQDQGRRLWQSRWAVDRPAWPAVDPDRHLDVRGQGRLREHRQQHDARGGCRTGETRRFLSGRTGARSRASSRRRTCARCSSTSSIRARRRANEPTPRHRRRYRAGPTARRGRRPRSATVVPASANAMAESSERSRVAKHRAFARGARAQASVFGVPNN